jgi:hypothetical protein
MDHEGHQDFLRKNKHAWQFAAKATDDYMLARLGLQNVLWSGFEVASQAIEKLLKSYLLYADHTLLGDADNVRKAVSREAQNRGRMTEKAHDVLAAYSLAAEQGLTYEPEMENRLIRINSHYASRYPDGGGPTSKGTDELNEIDEAVFGLWDSFARFDPDLIYIGGIASPIYAFHLHSRPGVHTLTISHAINQFNILVRANAAYQKRATRFNTEIWRRLGH